MAQSAKVRIGEKLSWLTDNIKGATKAEAVRRDATVVVVVVRGKAMGLLRRRCEISGRRVGV